MLQVLKFEKFSQDYQLRNPTLDHLNSLIIEVSTAFNVLVEAGLSLRRTYFTFSHKQHFCMLLEKNGTNLLA